MCKPGHQEQQWWQGWQGEAWVEGGMGRTWRGPGAHLVQHGIALGPLSLPKQYQASYDVRGHNVQVPEKLSEEVGDF